MRGRSAEERPTRDIRGDNKTDRTGRNDSEINFQMGNIIATSRKKAFTLPITPSRRFTGGDALLSLSLSVSLSLLRARYVSCWLFFCPRFSPLLIHIPHAITIRRDNTAIRVPAIKPPPSSLGYYWPRRSIEIGVPSARDFLRPVALPRGKSSGKL